MQAAGTDSAAARCTAAELPVHAGLRAEPLEASAERDVLGLAAAPEAVETPAAVLELLQEAVAQLLQIAAAAGPAQQAGLPVAEAGLDSATGRRQRHQDSVPVLRYADLLHLDPSPAGHVHLEAARQEQHSQPGPLLPASALGSAAGFQTFRSADCRPQLEQEAASAVSGLDPSSLACPAAE